MVTIEQQARQESLLPFLTDGESEAQRGDTICPGSHRASRRARVTKAMGGAPFQFVILRWGYRPTPHNLLVWEVTILNSLPHLEDLVPT